VESHFACHALIKAGLAKLWKSLEDNSLPKMVPSMPLVVPDHRPVHFPSVLREMESTSTSLQSRSGSSTVLRVVSAHKHRNACVWKKIDKQTCENNTFACEIHTLACRFLNIFVLTHAQFFRTHAWVWFQHARVWFKHAECYYYTHECDFDTLECYIHECAFHTHECDFDTLECDFQSCDFSMEI
jgi:hypothetical protein